LVAAVFFLQELTMTRDVAQGPRKRAEAEDAGALLQSWRGLGVRASDAAHRPRLARSPATDPPAVVAHLSAAEIGKRIAVWRKASPSLDALFLQGAPPADALRRFGLTHWTAGDARAASQAFATAAALAPDNAALWLDLAYTLHASGDPAQARAAFEWALALDPTPARGWVGLALAANQLADKRGAELAFRAALSCDPKLADAAFGLGLLCFEQRRYAEAAKYWRMVVALGCPNPVVYAGLGQALFYIGDFAGAAQALGDNVAAGGADDRLVRRFALARFLATAIAGDVEAAFAAYRDAAGARAEDVGTVMRAALELLAAYGHREVALRLGRARAATVRDDPILRYLFEVASGEKFDRAPRDYVVDHFDRFAEAFDRQLVDVLGYDAPAKLSRLVELAGKALPRAVDLGCGTGLAGPLLKPGRARLVGVDLAPRMLAKAAERGVYDALVEAEIANFLETTSERFELVFATDVLIYLGDLAGFLAGAARVTPPGGLLAVSVETTWEAPYRLLPSGRFAHDVSALRSQAAPWFALRNAEPTTLRFEAGARVHGSLVVLERRAA
jgi:predicted TPR repeat methyltransferase